MTADPDRIEGWTPSGRVTWTTDFGVENGFVGTMRGVFAARCSAARHIDLTHAIPPQALEVGALEIRHAWPYFAPGTLHVVVVDPGVGTARKVLLAMREGQCWIGPDNGILTCALGPEAQYFHLNWEPYALPSVSATFHGRDVFAPLAAAWWQGQVQPRDCVPCPEPVELALEAPRRVQGGYGLRVVMVDRFGNLVTNWEQDPREPWPKGASVEVNGRLMRIVKTYGDADPGECVALLNSWGHLEIAVRDGHAAQTLGGKRGDTVKLHLPS